MECGMGVESWSWPTMQSTRLKLIDPSMHDPSGEIFAAGAHMPLLIFLGAANQTRRTPEARQKRAERANQRGWGRSRWCVTMEQGVAHVRQNDKDADNTSGGGAEQSEGEKVELNTNNNMWLRHKGESRKPAENKRSANH